MTRDFKGVWIPKEIYLNEDLNWTDKIILMEIDSLDNENHCFASNEYFSNLVGVSTINVSKSINKLIKLGYVEKVSFNGRERFLRSLLSFTISEPYHSRQVCIITGDKHNNISNKPIKEKEINKEKLDYPPEHERDIKWSGSVISLNFKDYYEWKKLYPNIDLDDMLTNRDNWLRDKADDRARRNWFISTKAYFKKLNEDIG